MQLAIELDLGASQTANVRFFNADGSARRLLWCSDQVRMAHHRGEPVVCPYEGRENPCPPCCLEIARRAS